jgi:hypothetical protein
MAKRSITNISADDNVIQELHWDTATQKIEVVHEINLEDPLRDVRWTSIKPYYPGENDYIRLQNEFGLGDPDVITEYIYTEIYSDEYDEPHAVKFPESGDYYPLSQLRHVVVVRMNEYGGGGGDTKTSGEALAD